MSITDRRDIGSVLLTRTAIVPTVLTQGTSSTGTGGFVPFAGDGVAQNGIVIDRGAFSTHFLSCQVVVPFRLFTGDAAVGGIEATAIATVAARLQDATASGGTFANHGSSSQSASIGDTTTGASTTNGVLAFNVDLSGANQFVRVVLTPSINATGATSSGAATVVANHLFTSAAIVFGGGDVNPAST